MAHHLVLRGQGPLIVGHPDKPTQQACVFSLRCCFIHGPGFLTGWPLGSTLLNDQPKIEKNTVPLPMALGDNSTIYVHSSHALIEYITPEFNFYEGKRYASAI